MIRNKILVLERMISVTMLCDGNVERRTNSRETEIVLLSCDLNEAKCETIWIIKVLRIKERQLIGWRC